jgi:hypothetical protein
VTRAGDAMRGVPARGGRRGRWLAVTLDAENVTRRAANGQQHAVRRFPQHFKGLLEEKTR